MKVIIAYPPLDSHKGYPTLGQNRQFQFFKEPTYIYPVVPATAATLLKQAGHEVIWLDGIAEGWTYKQFLDFIQKEEPDLIAFETKTPVIKQHWKIINEIKGLSPQIANPGVTKGTVPKIVLFGDHVTALPEESFQNSQVDFVLTGGDYDFLLLNLCNNLKSLPLTACSLQLLEPGIYYRQDGQIRNTGKFQLNHDLNSLPFIDRDLTRWQLYAYKNGNYKRTPGTYIMSGRDCWWGKCTFCFIPSTGILTNKGVISIKDIVEGNNGAANGISVLTHRGVFRSITKTFKRFYKGPIVNLELYCLKQNLESTPNHKILALKRSSIKRCSKHGNWDYSCVPGRISNRLNCDNCEKQYYQDYRLDFTESGELETGDFVAIPMIRKVMDKKYIDVKRILEQPPLLVQTTKKIPHELIEKIINKHILGASQREIARVLGVDRLTVRRYIKLYAQNELMFGKKLIIEENGCLKYEYGKKLLPQKIPLTAEFLRFVGYYLAEGHVSKIKNRPNSYYLVLTFSSKEKIFIEDVQQIINKLFCKIDVRQHLNKRSDTIQIGINSSALAVLFKTLFGDNSYNKKIPEEFMYLPFNKQKELLKGLFRGDGHLRIREGGKGGSEYILQTVSTSLANQVVAILLRNKAIPRSRMIIPSNKKYSQVYDISLSRYDIGHIFPDVILPKVRMEYRHGFVLNNYVMIPIKKALKSDYKGMVYNLEIDKDHSYAVNNVAVKNCSWPTLYPKFRSRTPDNVLDEIGGLIKNYGIREIMDDTGTFPAGDWLRDFCQGMVQRGYNKKIFFDCNMRFGALTKEDFSLMKRANFRLLLFGLESANQKTLDKLNKNLKIERVVEDCRLARKAGLYPHITIMFGYPWETYAEALKTLKLGKWLLNKGYAYTMQATMVIPYPGTSLFDECRQQGWLKTTDWDDYDMKQPVMRTDIPEEKIMRLVQGMYKVTFQPQFILRKVFSLKDFDDLKYYLRAGKKVFGHIFDFKQERECSGQ
ncbi:MAG: radical SAM protein [Candidatus Omnitrophica bacterium]|nr:radical SAM protein [Candidatus Omnitrophota bacterium]MDD5591979.1 radical SAM protein [Candidatus Omnitrophota bacterium]